MKNHWIMAACALSYTAHAATEAPVEPPPETKPAEEELKELVVVATKTEEPWIDSSGSVTQISAEEMVREGVFDLGGITKYDPTVSAPFDFSSGDGAFAYGQSGYGGFNIRGIEGNRVAIELDGIRQPPQYVSTSFDQGSDGSGGAGRDYFDPAMFEMVEILKGGASALYGSDALGGVVSMRTPEPEDLLGGKRWGGLARAQYISANDSVAAQLGGAITQGDWSFLLTGVSRTGHEMENNGHLPPNPVDFTSNAILGKANYHNGAHTLRFGLEAYERDTEIDARSATESSFSVFNKYVHNEQWLERQRASVVWAYEPASGWVDHLETQFYYQSALNRSDSDSAAKDRVIGGVTIPGRTRRQSIRFDTDIAGISMQGRREFQSGEQTHQLLGGWDYSWEYGENQFTRNDSVIVMDRNRTSFAPANTQRLGWFIQDEWKIQERWFITPGVRLDFQSIEPDLSADYLERLASLGSHGVALAEDYDNLALSPRLSVAYKPTSETQLYGTYARGIRNPTAEELSMIFDHPPSGGSPAGSMTVPNPDLEEEESHAFELGAKAEGDWGRAQVAGFYTLYRNFLENGVRTGEQDDVGRDILTTVNRGRVDIYGFEVGGVYNLDQIHSAADGWSVSLNTGKAIGINRTDDVWLNSVEPWRTVGFLAYDSKDETWGVRLTGTYVAAVKHVDDTTAQGTFFRPPAYFVADIGGYWKPTDSLTLHAGINNLFDEQYWSWGSVRRGNGHLGGDATTDRNTAPGTNFHISITKTF